MLSSRACLAGLCVLLACTPAFAANITEADVLNFALNLVSSGFARRCFTGGSTCKMMAQLHSNTVSPQFLLRNASAECPCMICPAVQQCVWLSVGLPLAGTAR
jgi:hypothetical protein